MSGGWRAVCSRACGHSVAANPAAKSPWKLVQVQVQAMASAFSPLSPVSAAARNCARSAACGCAYVDGGQQQCAAAEFSATQPAAPPADQIQYTQAAGGQRLSHASSRSSGVLRRPSLPDPSGASDREGTARRNWHGWKSGAGMVCLPQCRASSARGPPLTRLGDLAFWPDKGRQGSNGGGAEAARAIEGVTECAPHPAHALSHACVCARDTGACNMPWVQQRRCWRRTLRESSRERRVGDGAG